MKDKQLRKVLEDAGIVCSTEPISESYWYIENKHKPHRLECDVKVLTSKLDALAEALGYEPGGARPYWQKKAKHT